jgi:hypothetical protein
MLHYEEKKCVCTNNARKINDQKRLLQKNSLEQSLEKCLIVNNYENNKRIFGIEIKSNLKNV